jgi:phosphoadenosine phosphosulfate reductase
VELRRHCCDIRKSRPLARALQGFDAWVTGLRRDQAATRSATPVVAEDAAHGGIAKIAPLVRWSEEQVWGYIRSRGLPYHGLYDRGYRSIGCAPCTRAVREGEDSRAGRWWWEQGEVKECGLHWDALVAVR